MEDEGSELTSKTSEMSPKSFSIFHRVVTTQMALCESEIPLLLPLLGLNPTNFAPTLLSNIGNYRVSALKNWSRARDHPLCSAINAGTVFTALASPRRRLRDVEWIHIDPNVDQHRLRWRHKLLGFLRVRLLLVVEPFFIAECLPELPHGGIEVARFAGLQGFRHQGARERPARQFCEFQWDTLVNKSDGSFDGVDLAAQSGG